MPFFKSEIGQLRGKIGDVDFEMIRRDLNWKADVFSKQKLEIGCCILLNTRVNWKRVLYPTRREQHTRSSCMTAARV